MSGRLAVDADVNVGRCPPCIDRNGLEILGDVMRSTTRLYASRQAMDDPSRRGRIEDLALVLRSVLSARERVMIEMNVPGDRLESLVEALPCMRQPTVSSLHGEDGFAVKVAVPRVSLPRLIPQIRSLGGVDIAVSRLSQLVT